eukprot:m.78006 g.78006  ORF g.78006 m.78006 type:complete len:1490 (+) comp20717_c0_seq1:150-4619(+)
MEFFSHASPNFQEFLHTKKFKNYSFRECVDALPYDGKQEGERAQAFAKRVLEGPSPIADAKARFTSDELAALHIHHCGRLRQFLNSYIRTEDADSLEPLLPFVKILQSALSKLKPDELRLLLKDEPNATLNTKSADLLQVFSFPTSHEAEVVQAIFQASASQLPAFACNLREAAENQHLWSFGNSESISWQIIWATAFQLVDAPQGNHFIHDPQAGAPLNTPAFENLQTVLSPAAPSPQAMSIPEKIQLAKAPRPMSAISAATPVTYSTSFVDKQDLLFGIGRQHHLGAAQPKILPAFKRCFTEFKVSKPESFVSNSTPLSPSPSSSPISGSYNPDQVPVFISVLGTEAFIELADLALRTACTCQIYSSPSIPNFISTSLFAQGCFLSYDPQMAPSGTKQPSRSSLESLRHHSPVSLVPLRGSETLPLELAMSDANIIRQAIRRSSASKGQTTSLLPAPSSSPSSSASFVPPPEYADRLKELPADNHGIHVCVSGDSFAIPRFVFTVQTNLMVGRAEITAEQYDKIWKYAQDQGLKLVGENNKTWASRPPTLSSGPLLSLSFLAFRLFVFGERSAVVSFLGRLNDSLTASKTPGVLVMSENVCNFDPSHPAGTPALEVPGIVEAQVFAPVPGIMVPAHKFASNPNGLEEPLASPTRATFSQPPQPASLGAAPTISMLHMEFVSQHEQESHASGFAGIQSVLALQRLSKALTKACVPVTQVTYLPHPKQSTLQDLYVPLVLEPQLPMDSGNCIVWVPLHLSVHELFALVRTLVTDNADLAATSHNILLSAGQLEAKGVVEIVMTLLKQVGELKEPHPLPLRLKVFDMRNWFCHPPVPLSTMLPQATLPSLPSSSPCPMETLFTLPDRFAGEVLFNLRFEVGRVSHPIPAETVPLPPAQHSKLKKRTKKKKHKLPPSIPLSAMHRGPTAVSSLYTPEPPSVTKAPKETEKGMSLGKEKEEQPEQEAEEEEEEDFVVEFETSDHSVFTLSFQGDVSEDSSVSFQVANIKTASSLTRGSSDSTAPLQPQPTPKSTGHAIFGRTFSVCLRDGTQPTSGSGKRSASSPPSSPSTPTKTPSSSPSISKAKPTAAPPPPSDPTAPPLKSSGTGTTAVVDSELQTGSSNKTHELAAKLTVSIPNEELCLEEGEFVVMEYYNDDLQRWELEPQPVYVQETGFHLQAQLRHFSSHRFTLERLEPQVLDEIGDKQDEKHNRTWKSNKWFFPRGGLKYYPPGKGWKGIGIKVPDFDRRYAGVKSTDPFNRTENCPPRFANNVESQPDEGDWAVGYHGTSPAHLRSILSTGIGKSGDANISVAEWHIQNHLVSDLIGEPQNIFCNALWARAAFLSPSYKYAAYYSGLAYEENGKVWVKCDSKKCNNEVLVVLVQARVNPEVLKPVHDLTEADMVDGDFRGMIYRSTVNPKEGFHDPNYKLEELEWRLTQPKDDVVPYRVIVKSMLTRDYLKLGFKKNKKNKPQGANREHHPPPQHPDRPEEGV